MQAARRGMLAHDHGHDGPRKMHVHVGDKVVHTALGRAAVAPVPAGLFIFQLAWAMRALAPSHLPREPARTYLHASATPSGSASSGWLRTGSVA